jgi:type IV pilus assembly protein PilV
MNQRQNGFTIVEVLVAVIVLSVGILALASTAAVITRQVRSARQQTVAAAAAQSRFDRLHAVTCTGITSSTASGGGLTEHWIVTNATRVKSVTDTVKWTDRGVQKTQVYRSLIPCLVIP